MLLCFAMFGVARAQEVLTVHDGTGTNGYVPIYGFYADAYLKCEMVYPAAELGDMENGTITGLTFYASSPATEAWTATWQVFVTEVNDATISAFNGPGTVVYEGALDGTGSEMTINFATPYTYQGGNLLVGVYNTVTGNYKSVTWAGETVSGASVQGYSYSGLGSVSPTQRNFLPKTTFTYTPGEAPACAKPKNLAVNYEGGTTATVTWTGDATLYNIDVNGTVTNDVTSPYTLTGLALATTYTVMVQANCGDRELSDWTNPVSFTTDLCMPEDQCELTFVLNDSYGDGWNGNAITVTDVETNEVLAVMAAPTHGGGNVASSDTYTLGVCDGRELQFSWTTGSYISEVSYTVTDINGDVIVEGSGAGFETFTYTVSCVVTNCRKPTNLAATEVGNRTATLSWTENGEARAWNLLVNGVLVENVDNPHTLTGLTPETTYTVQVSPVCEIEKWSDEISFTTLVACPAPTELAVAPTPISANVTWNGYASSYNLRYGTCEADPTQLATIVFHANDVWGDGTGYQMLIDADATAYGDIIPETGALSMDCSGNEAIYAEFEYKIPANADGDCTTSNIVLNNTITLQIPAGTYDWCITNPTPDDRIWIASSQGNIGGRADDYVFEADMTYEFVVSYNDETGNDQTNLTITCNNMVWTTVNNVTSPYTIEGLTPETEYYLEVQAVCGGEDGESAWTTTTFTTPSNCDAPLALNVPAETLMPTTATLAWTGYQDSFEARYRIPATEATLFFEDFEGLEDNALPEGWTSIDSDGDGNGWYSLSGDSWEPYSHSGQGLVTSASYSGSALTPDNWLVTPQIALQGTMRVWLRAQDPDYAAEHYAIYLSTTGNEVADFTTTLVEEAYDLTGEYIQISADLSAYNGQMGYIAIRHFNCSDEFRLNVDDFGIYGGEVPAGEWIVVTSDVTSVDIEELDPETTYEWQVRGENRSCTNGEDEGYTPWSEMGTFTTPGLCDNPNNFDFETLEATTATLTWTGYQDSYNVMYRTAETYDQLFYDDLEEGVDGWTTPDDENLFTLSFTDGSTMTVYGFIGDGTTQTIISPEFESAPAGYTLSFFYYAYQASIQTFNVGFSTDGENFTYTGEVTTDDENYAGYQEVEVPEGTKYFAIQSSGASNYLLLGDFWIYANYVAPGEWVELTVNEPSVTMEPLVPETLYQVYVQGICGEGEEDVTSWIGGYFMTPELTTVTQTIALGAGVNWISVNVETDLDALKAALEATGNAPITIQSKDNGLTTYNGTRWRGTLNTLDVNQMYMITVDAACEITLEGMPINPEEHPITIHNGANWIAFPLAQSMALSNAFAGFNAAGGDVVNSKNSGLSTYNGTRWRGQLTTLVPGEGYIYNSTAAEDKTLIFPANTSKAAQNGTLSLSTKKTMQDKSVNLPVSISLQKTSTNVKPENKSVANKEKENFAVAKKSSENCKSIKK